MATSDFDHSQVIGRASSSSGSPWTTIEAETSPWGPSFGSFEEHWEGAAGSGIASGDGSALLTTSDANFGFAFRGTMITVPSIRHEWASRF
jgi:hypothetical protein